MKPLSIFDGSTKEHPVLTWCEALPGIVLTIIVMAAFVAGMWGLWAIWQMGEVVQTAVRG